MASNKIFLLFRNFAINAAPFLPPISSSCPIAYIDSIVSQLNQGAVDGSVVTINDRDQTGSSSYDFTDQDAMFTAIRNMP